MVGVNAGIAEKAAPRFESGYHFRSSLKYFRAMSFQGLAIFAGPRNLVGLPHRVIEADPAQSFLCNAEGRAMTALKSVTVSR
jgi:hypothetical protein